MPPRQHPPEWTAEELERDRRRAIDVFRAARIQEPLETYARAFDVRRVQFAYLLQRTADLTALAEHAIEILSTPHLRDALRYVAGPPISEDDLKTLADAETFTRTRLEADPAVVRRFIDTITSVLDVRRFPWISPDGGGRAPDDDERHTAILASAAILATRDAETLRRSQGKEEQELLVETRLLARGYEKVPTRPVYNLGDAPRRGEFCRETMVVGRKADFVIGLFDNRMMPMECKVSNSALNSIKRLNNDAAQKAEVWRKELGPANCVPAAVLSGVYHHHMLVDAQRRGLSLFWAHSLDAQLLDWILATGG